MNNSFLKYNLIVKFIIMEFKLLNQLNKKQINQLIDFVKNEDNMEHLTGKIYNEDKIKKIIKLTKKDFKNEFKNIQYIYVALLLNKNLIGLGFIMPYYQDDNVNRLNISIDKEYLNNNYESKLIDMLIYLHHKFITNKALISIVNKNDKYYNKIFKKFILKKKIKINNKDFNIYQLL